MLLEEYSSKGQILRNDVILLSVGFLLQSNVSGILQWPNFSVNAMYRNIENNFMSVDELESRLVDKRLLIDNYRDNYYFNNQALSMFSSPARDIIEAETK